MAKGGLVKVTVDTKRLDLLMNGTGLRANAVLDKTARDLEAVIKEQITVMNVIDTGNLRSSIHVESAHKPFERIVSDATEYGLYQHEGYHSKGGYHSGRPFMRKATERLQKSFSRAWEQLFR